MSIVKILSSKCKSFFLTSFICSIASTSTIIIFQLNTNEIENIQSNKYSQFDGNTVPLHYYVTIDIADITHSVTHLNTHQTTIIFGYYLLSLLILLENRIE